MAVEAQPTVLDAGAQALTALWAVKTGLLLELALRQQYPGQRTVQGHVATPQELAWLRGKTEPPPLSMVWLGCWDCQKASPVNYEPSGAGLPTQDGATVTGHLTTFTLGYIARVYPAVWASPGTSTCSKPRSALARASYSTNGRNQAGNGAARRYSCIRSKVPVVPNT